jgi:hypothetical protein
MREGYEKYSDGLWRKVFAINHRASHGAHYFMQVRSEDGVLLETINGKNKITAALARVRKLNFDDEHPAKSSAPPSDVPEQS